jgi:hypothetical protein
MNIPNPFIDCSLPELVEAWNVFSQPRDDGSLDREAMEWVTEALDRKLIFSYATIGTVSVACLIEC